MTESEVKSPTIMSVSLKYGVISAALAIVIFVIRSVTTGDPMGKSWAWTLVGIAIGIAVIVLAHREYKNNGNGFMSYGQGFKIAFVVTFISFLVSGAFTLFYMTVIDTGLMETFYDNQRAEMEAAGQPDEQIDVALEWTKKLFWVFFLVGGLFSSALMGVVVPIFTQKRNPEPTI